jgi:uncharacterized protein DUF1616
MLIRPGNRLLFLLSVCWACLLTAFLLRETALKIVFGLPVVLVFPGVLVLHLLNLHLKPLERWALVGAASLAVLIGSVMVSSLTSGGIKSSSILALLASVTVLLCVGNLVMLRSRPRSMSESPTISLAASVRPDSKPPTNWRSVVAWCISGSVIATSLCGAIWLSMTSERAISEPNFTQLSMIRQGDSKVCRIEVSNLEGSEAKYQLEISFPVTGTALQTITVKTRQTYQKDIVVDHPGEVVARLYGGSATSSGYRQVKAVIP